MKMINLIVTGIEMKLGKHQIFMETNYSHGLRSVYPGYRYVNRTLQLGARVAVNL